MLIEISKAIPNTAHIVMGNLEDVYLLVAFEDGPITQLILIEAEAETELTNKQTLS
jgi:hypothetical protein